MVGTCHNDYEASLFHFHTGTVVAPPRVSFLRPRVYILEAAFVGLLSARANVRIEEDGAAAAADDDGGDRAMTIAVTIRLALYH